jgi:hypothetical protein
MTVQTFRDLLTKKPFEPFAGMLSGGERFEVRHPEMGWLTRTTLYVGTDPDRGGVPGDAAMCSLLHIASVEPIRNGRARRHRG